MERQQKDTRSKDSSVENIAKYKTTVMGTSNNSKNAVQILNTTNHFLFLARRKLQWRKAGHLFCWTRFLIFQMLKNRLLKFNSSTMSTVALQPIKAME